MSAYSKEFAAKKSLVIKDLKEFIGQIETGEIQIDGNEPKMSKRVLRSLMLSTDKTYEKLVNQYLDPSFKYKVKKGKKAVPRIESFKNSGRTLIETKLPKPLRRIETDRIHHGTPLEIGAVVEDMPPDELLKFLQEHEKEGVFFADSDQNTRGGSYDEREHTGARPKASKSKVVYPNQYGPDGVTDMSGHPRGTRDKMFNIDARPTTAAAAREVIRPLLEQNAVDQDLARQVANPRRTFINDTLVEQGLIESGVDIFSADIDDVTLQRVAPYLKTPEMQRRVAESFKTPVKIEGGVVKYQAVDPIAAAMDPLMKNRIGALTGVLFEGYNIDTIKKLESGDLTGAGTDILGGAVAGAAIEAGTKALGVSSAVGNALLPVAATQIFNEGRDNSTTTYLANKYGPSVGMSTYNPEAEGGPAWRSMSEAVPMPTEDQKPQHVQATEDALDFAGNKIQQAITPLINDVSTTVNSVINNPVGALKKVAGSVVFGF